MNEVEEEKKVDTTQGKRIRVYVRYKQNVPMEIDINNKQTVMDLKDAVEDQDEKFDCENIKLIIKGKILKNEKTLEEYNIQYDDIISLVATKLREPKKPPAPAEGAPATTDSATSTSAVPATTETTATTATTPATTTEPPKEEEKKESYEPDRGIFATR